MSYSQPTTPRDESRVDPAAPRPSDGATAAIVERPMADELPASQEQRPPRRGWTSLLDDEQVGVAAAAVRAILEDSIRHGRTLTGSGSGGYFRYPSVHCLELQVAPGPAARLVHPESMEEMSLALHAAAADAVEMLRGSSICRYISMDRSTGLSHHITSHVLPCLLFCLVCSIAST
jgi:hypothetical protein